MPVLAQPILDDTLLQTLTNFARAGYHVKTGELEGWLVISIKGMARCPNRACRKFAPREFVGATGCVHCDKSASTGTEEAQL